MGFSFVLSPFQYHNALQKAQMRYRLLVLSCEEVQKEFAKKRNLTQIVITVIASKESFCWMKLKTSQT